MRAFFDSNVLVYAFSLDAKAEAARELLEQGGVIGVQSLNEFASVARRKLRFTWPELHAALERIALFCELGPAVDLNIHRTGLGIAERYRLSIYDGLIVAAALRAECQTFWSEDMQNGLVVAGRLTIRNPFVQA